LQLGFSIAPGVVLTTVEAHAPWKYDPEFQGAINHGTAKVVKNSHEVELCPVVQGPDPLRLSSKDFSLEMRGSALHDQVTENGSSPGQATVLRRVSPGALAVLKMRNPPATPALTVAPAALAARDSWEQVVVFRQRSEPVTGKPFLEALALGARRDGKSIRLSGAGGCSGLRFPDCCPGGSHRHGTG
jgi:hypothetical protein